MADVIEFSEPRAFFSSQTPPQLRQLLNTAMVNPVAEETERLLMLARDQWPLEPDTHIALYKCLFVAGKYNRAEAGAWRALNMAAVQSGFTRNYKRLTTESANWTHANIYERLYLFSLKALGVCRLRRGRVKAAYSVLEKLSQLDPMDEIGGLAYYQIAASFFEDE